MIDEVMKNRNSLLTLILFVSFGLFLFLITNNDLKYTKNNLHTFYGHYIAKDPTLRTKKLDREMKEKSAYLVNTKNCQIVRWPPFDDQVLPIYKNRTNDSIDCNHKKHLNILIERYNFTGVRVDNNSGKKIDCFYSEIHRKKGTDSHIVFSPSVEFDINFVQYFPSTVGSVKITCFVNKGEIGYEKIIPLIPDVKTNPTKDSNLPNILFIGLDSISRLNFDRHFPKTAQLLAKHDFYTMYGYNKVADNTFVNLTPLLTGFYLEDIWNETISKTIFLNYFPFIWKDYSKRGYNTLLMEDAPDIATFNYLKIGFDEPPTDYYLRPFSLAIEKDVHNDCYLDKTEIENYYDYIYDFTKAMNTRNERYFAFTFMARLTHDNINSAGFADPMVYNLFNKLFEENLLMNTLVVFFSDHGIRFGKIRETLSGKLEERMPFMHIYVPNEMRNNFLDINQNRLTTPFDIHATLKHIITGKHDTHLKYGKSLLEEIPEERSCESIPVLEHWCSCQSSQAVKDLHQIKPISLFIVDHINQILAKDFSDKCVELILDRTISAFEQHLSEKVLQFEQSLNDVIGRHVIYNKNKIKEKSKHYLVTIAVKPSNALFEATVNMNTETKNMVIVGDVSRINKYGNQSVCIDNQFARRYCFCKHLALKH